MVSHARSDRAARPTGRAGALFIAAVSLLVGCHVSDVLGDPPAPGDDTPPAGNPPAPPSSGVRMLLTVAGSDQRDTVGGTLDVPYTVRVTDQGGQPVAGVTVTWQIVDGGGSLSPSQGVTDAGGVARSTHTFGPVPGPQRVQAIVSGAQGSPRAFTATSLHGEVHSVNYEVEASDVAMGDAMSPGPRVVLRDRFGNVTGDVTGNAVISIVPGTGTPLATLSGTLAVPLSGGRAEFSDVHLSLVGIGYRLRVTTEGKGAESRSFEVTLLDLH